MPPIIMNKLIPDEMDINNVFFNLLLELIGKYIIYIYLYVNILKIS